MSLAARRSVAKSRRLSFWLLVLFALVINAVAAACALLGLLTMWLSGWSLPTLKQVEVRGIWVFGGLLIGSNRSASRLSHLGQGCLFMS